MVIMGKISSFEGSKIRVVFPERNNIVSPPLPSVINQPLVELMVGDTVVVGFTGAEIRDGVVLGKINDR